MSNLDEKMKLIEEANRKRWFKPEKVSAAFNEFVKSTKAEIVEEMKAQVEDLKYAVTSEATLKKRRDEKRAAKALLKKQVCEHDGGVIVRACVCVCVCVCVLAYTALVCVACVCMSMRVYEHRRDPAACARAEGGSGSKGGCRCGRGRCGEERASAGGWRSSSGACIERALRAGLTRDGVRAPVGGD